MRSVVLERRRDAIRFIRESLFHARRFPDVDDLKDQADE